MKKSRQNIAPSMIDPFVIFDLGLFFVPIWITAGSYLYLEAALQWCPYEKVF